MLTVTVSEITTETDAVKSFTLQRTDRQPFDRYEAGAHIDVTGPSGITRQYSLCSPPDQTDSYTIAVKREPDSRGGSAALHDDVLAGDQLTISTPRNLFALDADADDHVLVAAGIGVTPMLSMAYRLAADGGRFRLHYFASTRDTAPFAALLEGAPFAESVTFHFGLARDAQPAAFAELLAGSGSRTHLYTCGPKEFMNGVAEVGARVLGDDHVHIEHFQALEPVSHDGDSFEVELDGEVHEVAPGRSIVDVLADAGVEIDTSCREGICGTCVLSVVEGVPDHRDNCLTRKEKEAGDQIATCVSRSKSPRLVVDW